MKENKKGKLQAIPPQTIWAVQGLFNLEQVGSDFLLECGLPRMKLGALLSKIKAFLSLHRHQAPIMKTSIKKG
jgi:hypothetical protein